LLDSATRARFVGTALQVAGILVTVNGLGIHPRIRTISSTAIFMADEGEIQWWRGLVERHGVATVEKAVERSGARLHGGGLPLAIARKAVADHGVLEEMRQRLGDC